VSRLFITPKELNFISDITKELVKDIVGQKIYYYPINELKTRANALYNEAYRKVFDNPIVLDALVDARFQNETTINQEGVDAQYRIEVFLQYRDIVDRGIAVSIGDFFSFSDIFYEVADQVIIQNIYGLPEHKSGIKITGTKARETQFQALLMGPTDIDRPEPDAVQTVFHQQRGQATNAEGPTGDKRDLQRPEILGTPITGAKEVSLKGDVDRTGSSSFYGDDD